MHLLIRSSFMLLSLLCVAMINAQDIQLVDYYMSECQSHYRSEIERIAEINQKDSSLTEIVFSAKGNCGMMDSITVSHHADSIFLNYDFRKSSIIPGGDTIQINDTIFDITEPTFTYYAPTMCDCCFTFNLTLSGYDDSKNYTFIGNGKEIPVTEHRFPLKPVSFEIFEGDTINYSDLYGFKQGRWILRNQKGLITEDANYENGNVISGKTDKVFDNDDNLISEWDGGMCWDCIQLFYYPSGNLKRKCFGFYSEKCEDYPDESTKKKRKIK